MQKNHIKIVSKIKILKIGKKNYISNGTLIVELITQY